MKRRLHPDRSPAPQIRTLLEVEVQHAISEAALYEDADVLRRVEVVRQIRKATKRSRAIVSLLDPSTGDRFNRHLRHCARQLSSMRDRDVIQQTLGDLSEMDPKLHRLLRKKHLRERMLEFEESDSFEVPVAESTVIDNVRRELGWILENTSSIGRRDLRWKLLVERVGRSWQRARHAFNSEWSSENSDALHDARKALIRLESQLVFVERLVPSRIRKARKGLRAVAHELGLDRDLILIQERAEELGGSRSFSDLRDRFIDRVGKDRSRHLKKLRSRGKKLLDTPTSRFLAKMKKSVKSARKGTDS